MPPWAWRPRTPHPRASLSDPLLSESLKTRALRLLARREHSRVELGNKLAPHAESPEQLQTLLDELIEQGFLSDARFAAGRARSRAARYGSSRIARELRDKGVAAEVAANAVAGLRDNDLATARALWTRKFGALPANATEKARQIRFLQARGFSFDVIRRVLREEDRLP